MKIYGLYTLSDISIICKFKVCIKCSGMALSILILNPIDYYLVLIQRPEQNGFTLKRSTIDWILGLRVLIERRLKNQQGFLAVYVNFKKAYDSGHLLRKHGIPAGILTLISALRTNTESAIKREGGVSHSVPGKI